MSSPSSPASPWLPWVAPFAVFLLLSTLESSTFHGIPYESLYTIKTAAVAGLLWWFRAAYPPPTAKGCALAVVLGIVGVVLWIALTRVQELIPGLGPLLEAVMGKRVGYDPFAEGRPSPATIAFVAIRLVGLTLVVPVMEELFWRGFLARYLIAEDFRSVPQGKFTRSSFLIVTAALAAVHPEVLAALAWGALINWLYHKTENVWACVTMHAVTNGLLGGYILATGQWVFW